MDDRGGQQRLLHCEGRQRAGACLRLFRGRARPAHGGQSAYTRLGAADCSVIAIQNVCLSYYYCFPNKLFESVLAGLPVAVADLLELRRFVDQYGVGLVMDETDPKAIAGAISGFFTKRITGCLASSAIAGGAAAEVPGRNARVAPTKPSPATASNTSLRMFLVNMATGSIMMSDRAQNKSRTRIVPQTLTRFVRGLKCESHCPNPPPPARLSLRIDLRNGVDRCKPRAYVFRSRL